MFRKVGQGAARLRQSFRPRKNRNNRLYAGLLCSSSAIYALHTYASTAEVLTQDGLMARYPSLALQPETTCTSAHITPLQWEHFDREGFVVLPKDQVFESHEDFERLRQRMDDIMMGVAQVPYDKVTAW